MTEGAFRLKWRCTALVPALMGLSLGALLGACVPLQESAPDRGDLFAPLHEADLSSFEQGLTLDEHTGRADHWTALGRAFLNLANCRPIDPAPPVVADDAVTLLLYELVRLEDRRRLRLVHQSFEAGVGAWHRGTVHTQFTSRTFFNRDAAPTDDDLIHWPHVEPEAWPDEWPAPAEVEFQCGQLMARDDPPELDAPFDEIDAATVTSQLLDEWSRAEAALSAAKALPDESGLRRRSVDNLLAHRGDLALLIAQREDARHHAADAIEELQRRAMKDLVESGVQTRPLRIARLAMELGEPEMTIEALSHLVGHEDDRVDAVARYFIVKTAWMQGWWEMAAEGGEELIDRPASLRSAHAYFAATANRYAGREDVFFAIGRTVLRDRRRDQGDPFLGALYRELLRVLASYDVDERTDEFLEELGPRHLLDERKIEFAEIALDMGRPEVADEMVQPILESTQDARRLPRLYALRALIAFMFDDRDTFDHYVGRLSNRPAELRQVIPRNRRAAFFANQDAELARVLRATLPLMAEWGDDDHARQLRRSWLETVVEHTQRFLRWAPDSVVSNDLTELYRLAGRLLEDHPRGYAERVGSTQPSASPLVLGTIDVPPAPPLDEAPSPRLRWPQLRSLLLIPRGGLPPESFVDVLEAPGPREESS